MELIDLDECSRFNGLREDWINNTCEAVMNKEQSIMYDSGKNTISFYSVVRDVQNHDIFESIIKGLLHVNLTTQLFQVQTLKHLAEEILIGQLTQLADNYEIGSVE